ncbi:hypothetical protein M1349_02360 [Patescibacteria group bacterium]|nr:hypothetical protein [Patescibacteria group bacterium]
MKIALVLFQFFLLFSSIFIGVYNVLYKKETKRAKEDLGINLHPRVVNVLDLNIGLSILTVIALTALSLLILIF